MKFFTTTQIRQLDLYTIGNEPIASIGLMERAADRLLQQFRKDRDMNTEVVIMAGPGNNGGDGLALGRMLLQIGYEVQVILLHSGKISADCKINKERLQESIISPDWLVLLCCELKELPQNSWTSQKIKETLKNFQKAQGLKGRELFHPLRIALTGRDGGAPLPLIISCLGRERTLEKLA